MARGRSKNLRYAILAVVISMVLWGIAHGGSTVEREYDIPVVFSGLPAELVIVDQSVTKINVRVQGSRAAFRSVTLRDLEYDENIKGAKTGRARYEVDDARLDLPRGLTVVGLSPSEILVDFERRGRKNVKVRPDLEGQPAEGFALGEVQVEPARVWLTGARSRVLRLTEVVTETIDVSGLSAATERQVKLSMGSDHVWMEQDQPVTVRIAVVPVEPQAGGQRERSG